MPLPPGTAVSTCTGGTGWGAGGGGAGVGRSIAPNAPPSTAPGAREPKNDSLYRSTASGAIRSMFGLTDMRPSWLMPSWATSPIGSSMTPRPAPATARRTADSATAPLSALPPRARIIAPPVPVIRSTAAYGTASAPATPRSVLPDASSWFCAISPTAMP